MLWRCQVEHNRRLYARVLLASLVACFKVIEKVSLCGRVAVESSVVTNKQDRPYSLVVPVWWINLCS